jgi:hypothetical protein
MEGGFLIRWPPSGTDNLKLDCWGAGGIARQVISFSEGCVLTASR